MKNYILGIIGIGFVGNAVYHTFSPYFKIKLYDKFKPGFESLEKTVKESDFLFICLPTPVNQDGKQDLDIIHETIESIEKIETKKIIILRSTLIPGTTRKLSNRFNQHFIFSPEFLTERTSILDSINAYRIILGGNNLDILSLVEKVFRVRYPHIEIFKTNFESAELVKYIGNCYFSVKISFMNEIYDICKEMNLDYEEVRKMFLSDQRVCNSHTEVPGHDGFRGFGGKCFPKDLKSFITFGKESLNLDMTMFKAANEVNERVREKKDWLDIKGATSENNYK